MTPELPRLPERYTPEQLLGQGAVGRVYSAIDTWYGERVAIKVLGEMPSGPARAVWERTLDAELTGAARLTHPRLVSPRDVGQSGDGRPFLVMPFVAGAPLSSLLQDPPPWTQLYDIFDQLLDALAFAHARGVLHRDIKPQNILLTKRPEGGHDLFVIDLGLAYLRERYEEQAIVLTEARGTPRYMAPEQLEGDARNLGPWTDLYAVGVMLYEFLRGEPPFQGPPMKVALAKIGEEAPPLALRPGYSAPKALEEVVARLLDRDINRRFALAADVRAALRALQHRPILPLPYGPPRPRALELPLWPTPEPRAPRPSLALAEKREPSLIGRDDICRHLWDAARQVRQTGAPLAILLEGEAGFGKTRLCRWLMEALEREGAMRVFHVRSPAGGEGPHAGLQGAIRRHLRTVGMTGEDLSNRIAAHFEATGGRNFPDQERLARWLSSTEYGGGLPSEERVALLAELLRRESWRGGTALWLDDAVWASPGEGLTLVEDLLSAPERGEEAPFLLLATARPDAYADRHQEEAARTRLLLRPDVLNLRINPLAENSILGLLDELITLESGLAARVAERAQGNPLYIIHLVQFWVRENLLEETRGPDGLRLRVPLNTLTEEILPPNISGLFESRIRATVRRAVDPRATRLALWGAALLGLEFSTAALERALDTMLDAERGRLGLRAAWDGGLLRGGRRYAWARFDHPLLWAQLKTTAEASPEGRTLAAACAQALHEASFFDREDTSEF